MITEVIKIKLLSYILQMESKFSKIMRFTTVVYNYARGESSSLLIALVARPQT